jgi:hypothetical protein
MEVKHDFLNFDPKKIGTSSGIDYGYGMYSAEHPEIAKGFGKNLYKLDIPDEYVPKMINWYSHEQTPEVTEILKKAGLPTNANGEQITMAAAEKMGGSDETKSGFQKAAEYLHSLGIKGNKYENFQIKKGQGADTHNYVLYDPTEAKILEKNNQPINLDTKGFKDEGNYRRMEAHNQTLKSLGLPETTKEAYQAALLRNAGRITRRSDQPSIARTTEQIKAGLTDPEFNHALALAQKHNPEFSLKAIKDMPESSIEKQHSIAQAYKILSQDQVQPQLKQAIFDDYKAKFPELISKEGITDYDDLVNKSYGQLRKEVDKQFDDMVKSGMKMSFHQGDANYLTSGEMLQDALINKHLYTYRGGDVHPYLNEIDPYYGLNTNEKFRAVHDYLGHGTTGSSFGRKGEELAYGAHAQTLSPLARIAAAAETRGQNSFVNYSGINAELEKQMMAARIARDQAIYEGKSPEKFDALLRDLGGQWQYAKQTGLALPPEMLELGYKGNIPEYVKAHLFPEHGISTKGYHYSNLSDLEETDPTKYGFGIRGAEAKRLALPGAIKERTYFYNEPGMREPGLGKYQYEADLNHFYDTENDPANIIKMADTFNRDKYGNLDVAGKSNDIERMMRQSGYHGYFNSNTGVGISFEPQKVREFSSD